MGIKIKRPQIMTNQRVIAISDIHGNLEALKALLKKVNYSTKDVLVLLGDIVEKGDESLATLRFVMDLSMSHTVYTICGNCDMICLELLKDNRNEELLRYIVSRKNTLVGEMCRELGIPINLDMDMLAVKKILREAYAKEIDFILNLPHVLETGNYVFAHAAVYPDRLEEMKPSQVMRADAFMEQGFHFDKYHVVGHWPAVLYCKRIAVCNPRIDEVNKIISIDGGNVLKRDGQLNALIIEDVNKDEFTHEYVDLLRKARILNTQEVGGDSLNIPWVDSSVQVLRKERDFSYCEHKSTGYKLWIPNDYLYMKKGEWHTEDITDYQIPVTFGDIVSVTEETSRGYLIKKDGICGWYYGLLEYIS